jgi:hypothetical protein
MGRVSAPATGAGVGLAATRRDALPRFLGRRLLGAGGGGASLVDCAMCLHPSRTVLHAQMSDEYRGISIALDRQEGEESELTRHVSACTLCRQQQPTTPSIHAPSPQMRVSADDNYVARLAGRQNRLIKFLSVFIRR